MSATLQIQLYDLISAARVGKLADVVERDAELDRLVRILLRPNHHHAIIVADPGSGKSSLTEALALRLNRGRYRPLEPVMYRLSTTPISNLMINGDSLQNCLGALREAAAQLTSAIIVIEDVQLLAAADPNRLELTLALFEALSADPAIRLVITTTTLAYHRYLRDDYLIGRSFNLLELATPSDEAITNMVEESLPRIERLHHGRIQPGAVQAAAEYGNRFGHGRSNPDAAIRLLEEAGVKVSLAGGDTVSAADIKAVVAERERLPVAGLEGAAHTDLAGLEPALSADVIGQVPALRAIAAQLARAQLGLGDSERPRGSFLLLGPSGVGKTETAKALARHVFHNPQALIRLDMSEYSEAHAAVRLIGSPPGYVGYEEGGQLTGAVMREPYSLVLLDEIEKAHPKLFDLFLQLLDDGRLTDSSGQTVNFTDTLVLATSNTGSTEIAQAAAAGHDVTTQEFLREAILPILLRTYRPEFINRFDAILIYQPLSANHLLALAKRNLGKLETRLSRTDITFDVSDATLYQLLEPHLNPLFGARPVARLIAQTFEAPIADALISGHLTGPITITGTEPWLSAAGVTP